jgi:hypothetical protein
MPLSVYHQQWNKKNVDKIREYQRRYYEKNKLKRMAASTKWRKENAEQYKIVRNKWREENKAKINKQYRDAYHKRANIKLARTMRARIRKALKGERKYQKTMEYIGLTNVNELMQRLEAKFLPGMSWENYGQNGWHVDHIIPLSSFDLTDKEQARRAFHYSNLQPLWAEDNLSKGSSRQ